MIQRKSPVEYRLVASAESLRRIDPATSVNTLLRAALALLGTMTLSSPALGQSFDQTIDTNQTSQVDLAKPGTTVLVAPGVTITAATGNGIVGQPDDVWALTNRGAITATNTGYLQGYGVYLPGSGSSLTNEGSIFAYSAGVRSTGDLSVTNAVGATIGASASGIIVESGSFELINRGTVSGGVYGVYSFSPTGAAIDNYGTIQGNGSDGTAIAFSGYASQGNTIHNWSGGEIVSGAAADGIALFRGPTTITNDSGGSISGGLRGISGSDLNTRFNVENAGSIQGGTGAGIYNYGGGSIDNKAGGTIIGAGGVTLGRGSFFDVTNAGTIEGTATTLNGAAGASLGAGAGIYIASSQEVTIQNLTGGVIRGGAYGIYQGLLNAGVPSSVIVNAGTVSGVVGIASTLGALDITNSGAVTGTGGTAISFDQAGGFTNLLTLDTGSAITGNVLGGNGEDNLVLNGEGTDDFGRYLNFETLTMQGDDWTLNGTGTFSTLATIDDGVLRVSGVLRAPEVDVNANGTLAGFGVVDSLVINAGTVAPGDGSVGGFGALTVRDYVGQGGLLVLNTYLDTDGSPSDQLVIDGGGATGSTDVLIRNTLGQGALTSGDGILVIAAINGGTTSDTAFSLAGPAVAGPYDYLLYRSGLSGDPDNWYLRSTLDCGLDPSDPACRDPDPGSPDYRPETSLYAAIPTLAIDYGRALLDTLHERVGEERFLAPLAPDTDARIGWGRVIGKTGRHSGGEFGILGDGGPDYDYDFFALQAGIDLLHRENVNGSTDRAGIYGAFGRATADVRHYSGEDAGTNRLNGLTAGAYWTHFGASGWYFDGVAQLTHYDVEGQGRVEPLSTDGLGFATSLEGGYPIALGNGWVIEPQAQIVYQSIHLSDGSDGAATIRFNDVESLAGRIGGRVARSWQLDAASAADKRLATAWGRASVWHEFLGTPTTEFSSEDGFVPFRGDVSGTSVALDVGFDAKVRTNVSLFASAGYEFSVDDSDYALSGKGGIKIDW